MKTLLKKLLYALLILFSIFILGIFIPMIISLFIVMTTPATLTNCIETAPFWIFTILGWIISSIYINEEITK